MKKANSDITQNFESSEASKSNTWRTVGYFAIAFLCAIALWFYVADYDREVEKTISNVQVELRLPPDGTGLVAESGKGNVVEITIKGKKADLNNLTADDIEAYIDVSDFETEIDENFTIQVDVPDGVSVVDSRELPLINVRLVSKVRRPFTVEAEKVAGSVGDCTYKFEYPKGNTVNIEGSQSIIERISSVKAEIDVGFLEGTRTFTESIVLYDSDGEIVPQTYLSLDKKQIDIKVVLYTSKELILKAEYVGGVYSVDEAGADISFDPAIVTVTGPLNVINDMDNYLVVEIDERDINLSSPSEVYSGKYDLKEIGNNVSYEGDISSVNVSIKQNIATKSVSFSVEDVVIILPDELQLDVEIKGLKINGGELSPAVTVDFKGLYDSISKLGVTKPDICIDFTGYVPDLEKEYTVDADIHFPAGVFTLDIIQVTYVLHEPVTADDSDNA